MPSRVHGTARTRPKSSKLSFPATSSALRASSISPSARSRKSSIRFRIKAKRRAIIQIIRAPGEEVKDDEVWVCTASLGLWGLWSIWRFVASHADYCCSFRWFDLCWAMGFQDGGRSRLSLTTNQDALTHRMKMMKQVCLHQTIDTIYTQPH